MTVLAAAERENIAAEMLHFLRRHVMEAWFPRCVDREAGGFFSDFNRSWNLCGPQQRMLEFQARQTRTAARLALAFPDESQWAETALHGFRYLRDAMWDHQHKGWFWMLDRSGNALENETKHAHSTAYAFQACALVYAATGEPGALELAREGFAWFDRVAHDDVHGGYRNWLHRDGTVVLETETKSNDPLGHPVGLKDVNVHGDWIESLTEFVAIQDDPAVRARLQSLTRLFLTHLLTEEGAIHQACYRDWRPQPGVERYGFHLQAAHRLSAAQPFLDDPQPAKTCARLVLDHAIARGWAGSPGGFWFAGPAAVPDNLVGISLVVRRRAWWVQFEGLRSLLLHGLRDPESDARYAGLFRAQWSLLRDRMCDKTFGGVYAICPDDLSVFSRPLGRLRRGRALWKGDIWKDASHEAESLVGCIRLLRNQAASRLGP